MNQLERTPATQDSLDRVVAWAAGTLGLILVVGWPIACLVNWSHIVSSHARLGYLAGDLLVVAPLCFVVWSGIRRESLRAGLLLLALCGAAAFDALNFGIYLIQEQFLLPPFVWGVLTAAVLSVVTSVAWHELGKVRS